MADDNYENNCEENQGNTSANITSIEIAIYAGNMEEASAEKFLEWASKPREHARCIVVLATPGGSASMAYRLSRAMQRNFDDVCIAIPWICKSAGTLLCLGANSLMFGENGELGPLDVQIPQKDELVGYSSGLTPLHALSVLQQHSFDYFEDAFLEIIQRSRGQISTTKAARIAIRLTVGLFGQIYSQIDPLQLGKTTRDMNIAQVYGERLSAVSQNLKYGALNRLLVSYPEHGFVIDGKEAEELFKNVMPIPVQLAKLVSELLPRIKQAIIRQQPFFNTLDDDIIDKNCAVDDAEENKLCHQEEKNASEPDDEA